jgi:hypothetical protein
MMYLVVEKAKGREKTNSNNRMTRAVTYPPMMACGTVASFEEIKKLVTKELPKLMMKI